jgi:hypothetical protein
MTRDLLIKELIEKHVREHFKEDEKAKNFEITFVSINSVTGLPDSDLDFYSGDVFKIASKGNIIIQIEAEPENPYFDIYEMTIRYNNKYKKLEILDKGKLVSTLSNIRPPIYLNLQK